MKTAIKKVEKEANLEPAEMQYRYFMKSIIPDSDIVRNNMMDIITMR